MTKLILIGSGGHARSVMDAIDANEYEVCGFIDEYNTGTRMGIPILGAELSQVREPHAYKYFVAIGDVAARKRWFEALCAQGLETINIIDKTAVISQTAQIGTGNFVGKYAIINAYAQIGNNNVINSKALVEHECTVGSHTHLSTNSTINGGVVIEDGVFLGSCSVCIEKTRVGEYTTVGAGSVVIRDIPSRVIAVGVPAKAIKTK